MTRRYCILAGFGLAGAALSGRPMRGARYTARRARQAAAPRDVPATGEAGGGPLIFDVVAEERWPVRGLDPALYVGEAVLDSYQYANAENTILRFTCHEPEQLQEGAQVYVQYGQDIDSRTNLPAFRWANVVND